MSRKNDKKFQAIMTGLYGEGWAAKGLDNDRMYQQYKANEAQFDKAYQQKMLGGIGGQRRFGADVPRSTMVAGDVVKMTNYDRSRNVADLAMDDIRKGINNNDVVIDILEPKESDIPVNGIVRSSGVVIDGDKSTYDKNLKQYANEEAQRTLPSFSVSKDSLPKSVRNNPLQNESFSFIEWLNEVITGKTREQRLEDAKRNSPGPAKDYKHGFLQYLHESTKYKQGGTMVRRFQQGGLTSISGMNNRFSNGNNGSMQTGMNQNQVNAASQPNTSGNIPSMRQPSNLPGTDGTTAQFPQSGFTSFGTFGQNARMMQEGGSSNEAQQFIQYIAKIFGIQSEDQLRQVVQKLGKQGLAQLQQAYKQGIPAEQVRQSMSGAQMARNGAQLFRKGGCPCKMEKGGECNCGGTKKRRFGGNVEKDCNGGSMKKKCGGLVKKHQLGGNVGIGVTGEGVKRAQNGTSMLFKCGGKNKKKLVKRENGGTVPADWGRPIGGKTALGAITKDSKKKPKRFSER